MEFSSESYDFYFLIAFLKTRHTLLLGVVLMFERYEIKKGDTLSDIANRFKTSKDILVDINNLGSQDSLRVGTDIVIPKNSENYFNYYTISKGDTLYGIARLYNINPELLASMNGLSLEDYIYAGQEIIIPKSGYSYYITKEGDTLDTSARMFKVSKENLLSNNPTIYLLAGQILVNKTK